MPFKVTYSGLNSNEPGKSPWADVIPYVSIDETRNWTSNLIDKALKVTLNGSLTESGFNKLNTNYADYGYSSDPTSNLLFSTGYLKIFKDTFSRCYGNLIVADYENPSVPKTILSGLFYVDSIDLNSQSFIGKLDYSISLFAYSGLKYSGIEPKETISFNEEGNGLVTISHDISAVGVGLGFNNSDPVSFNSIKTFVQNSTGVDRIKRLAFASGYIPTGNNISGVYVSGNGIGTSHSSNFILLSQVESINRLENTYSINETFRVDNFRSSPYFTKRFSAELNSGINTDYLVVGVTCDVVGAKDQSFSSISGSALNNITGEMYNAATGLIGSQTELCKTPITFRIDTTRPVTGYLDGQNLVGVDGSSSIAVSCSFDNSSESTFFDYNVSFECDESSNVTTLNLDGAIRGRGIHAAQKFADASGYLFDTLLSEEPDLKNMLYKKATGAFGLIAPTTANATFGILGERGGQSFGFIKDKGNVSVNLNSGRGEITLSANFSDEAAVSGYNDFSWSTAVKVGTPILVLKPSYEINGFNIIQDLGVDQKTEYAFDGNFTFSSGINGTIPILTKTSQPHTGILKLLISAEGFPDLTTNQNFYNENITLDNYNKSLDFVSGTTDSVKDFLGTGFSVSISKTGQNTLPIYSTYKVQS